MSKEEKQAIKELKHYGNITSYYKEREYTDIQIEKYINVVLNLIDKQQKVVEELKTITNQYQAYKVNGYGKNTIAFASKEYFDNGSFKEAPSIDELEDLTNQIAELKDKLDTKDKVIDKMADSMYNRPAYINLPYMKTKEEIKEYFYKEIENE